MGDGVMVLNAKEHHERRIGVLCKLLLEAQVYNPKSINDAHKMMTMFKNRGWKHSLTFSEKRGAYLATVTLPFEHNLTLLTCNANPAYAVSLLGAKIADIAKM